LNAGHVGDGIDRVAWGSHSALHLRKVRPRIRGEAAPMHSVRTGSGKPLLLVHGLHSSIGNWDPIVPICPASGTLQRWPGRSPS